MATDFGQFEGLLEAMFRCDGQGRLTGDAPLLYILRTTDAVLCRSHAVISDAAAAQMQTLAEAPRGRPGKWAEDYARYLSLMKPIAAVTAIRAGPLYAFPDDAPAISGCVAIDRTNLKLLEGPLNEWIEDAEHGVPMVAAVVHRRAVSVCASVRVSATVHCAGVETAPDYRGQGFAPRVVAAWAKMVRASGAEPFYATTFDNLASQAVARRLGLNLIGSEFSIHGKPAD